MKEDKIFNNKFNSGEVEYEVFGKINVNSDFSSNEDMFEDYSEKQLQQDIYRIFKDSKYFEEYSKSKKVPKSELAEMYYYFDERIPETNEVTIIEKFINVAEFMSISYDDLYKSLGPSYQEKIIRELDNKYGIFKKRKIKRLF